MRKNKFELKEYGYEMDDIGYACEYNGQMDLLKNIDVLLAEVCGANDEDNWYWIIQTKNNKFVWARGGCDYTGWDCLSWLDVSEQFETIEECMSNFKLSDYEHRKNVKECLEAQLNETLPFAIYTEYLNK